MDEIPHFEPPFPLTLFSGGPLLQLLGARGRDARLCSQETPGGPDRRAQAVGWIYEEGNSSAVCNQWLRLSPGLPVVHLNPLQFLWCLDGDGQWHHAAKSFAVLVIGQRGCIVCQPLYGCMAHEHF